MRHNLAHNICADTSQKKSSKWPISICSWSTSSIIKEMQVKATVNHRYMTIKLPKIKNIDNTNRGTIGTFTHWWCCYEMVQPLWKTGNFVNKYRFTMQSSNSTQRYWSNRNGYICLRRVLHECSIVALFIIARKKKLARHFQSVHQYANE